MKKAGSSSIDETNKPASRSNKRVPLDVPEDHNRGLKQDRKRDSKSASGTEAVLGKSAGKGVDKNLDKPDNSFTSAPSGTTVDKQLDNNLSTDLSTAFPTRDQQLLKRDSPLLRDTMSETKAGKQHSEPGAGPGKGSAVGSSAGAAAVTAAATTNSSAGDTALQRCVDNELDKYFAMLEGHPPSDLYKLVITQVETALFSYVLDVCGNNQSRAAEYLGVSRGTLRNRIVDLSLD